MAEIIYPNGETMEFEHLKEGKIILEKVEEEVGRVQARMMNDGRIMLMAARTGGELNHVASELVEDQSLGDIRGTVVVVSSEEMG